MQMVFSFRNVLVGTAIVVGTVYGYRSFYAGIDTKDVGKLIRAHRMSSPARQHVIRKRVVELYRAKAHYATVHAALGHLSPVTQAFAIEILAEKKERKAIPSLLDMLGDPATEPSVKTQLARAFRALPTKKAVPRLIALTGNREEQQVRAAAHKTLTALMGTGAQIKYGDGMRERWSLWWRDNGRHVRLQ